jgi:hypothetical protein
MMSRKARIAAYAVAVAVLLAVFALYTKPQIMVAVSDLVWSCFH